MPTKPYLSAADVKIIANAAEAEALRNSWPVSIAIVDDGGHQLAFQRLDGASAMSAQISQAKANSSAISRKETKVYEDIINNGRHAFLTAPFNGFLEGGVPVVIDGHVVGAVGVSGVKSVEDAQIAKAGIEALTKA